MYLGFRQWDKEKCKNVFVVCLEGTQEDIRRVKTTSKYFNQTKFESFTLGMLRKQKLIPVSKSGKEIKTSYILDEDGLDNKLGKIEDILEKFGIDDLGTLEEILKVHKHLLDHDYSTLPKEDFDLLFEKVKALDVIEEKQVDVSWFKECLSCANPLEVYNDRYDKIRSCDGKDYHFMQLTQEQFDLLKKVLVCGL